MLTIVNSSTKEHNLHQQAIVKDLTRTLDDNEKIITKQRLELVTILPMKIKINELTNELHHANNLNNSLRTENSILAINNQDLKNQVDTLKAESKSLFDGKTQLEGKLGLLEKQHNHIRRYALNLSLTHPPTHSLTHSILAVATTPKNRKCND